MRIPNIKLASKRILAKLNIEKVTKSGIILPSKDKEEGMEEGKLEIVLIAKDYEGEYKVGDVVSIAPTSAVFLPIAGEEFVSFFDSAIYFKYR